MPWLFELHKTQPVAHAIGALAFVCVLGMSLGSLKFRGIGLGTAGMLSRGLCRSSCSLHTRNALILPAGGGARFLLPRGSQHSSIDRPEKAIMHEEVIHKPSATQPDPRVQLAFERTFLAYERTRIAWVRTALALISFGFVIAKFYHYLREKQGETATLLSPRAIGLVMITIGLVGLILANWQERRALKALRERCPELPPSISGVMAVLITLLGVLALIGAMLR